MELMQKNINSYVYSPLNAFLLIKRLFVDIFIVQKHLRALIKNPKVFEFHNQKLDQISLTHLDLTGATEGLLRLQRIYKLNSSDFAEGIIDGKKTRSRLQAHDLFVIAKEASNLENQEYFAIEYFGLALTKIEKNGKNEDEVNLNELYTLLALTHSKTGNFERALNAIDMLLKLDNSNQKAKELRKNFKMNNEKYGNSKMNLLDPYNDYFQKNGKYSKEKEAILYAKACRGELKKGSKEISKLRCRYLSTNFFSKVAPFKVEEMSLEPTYVALFYDVFSVSEIKVVQNLTNSKLTPGKIQNLDDQLPKHRVVKTLFVSDWRSEVIKKLSMRAEVK